MDRQIRRWNFKNQVQPRNWTIRGLQNGTTYVVKYTLSFHARPPSCDRRQVKGMLRGTPVGPDVSILPAARVSSAPTFAAPSPSSGPDSAPVLPAVSGSSRPPRTLGAPSPSSPANVGRPLTASQAWGLSEARPGAAVFGSSSAIVMRPAQVPAWRDDYGPYSSTSRLSTSTGTYRPLTITSSYGRVDYGAPARGSSPQIRNLVWVAGVQGDWGNYSDRVRVCEVLCALLCTVQWGGCRSVHGIRWTRRSYFNPPYP